MRVECGGSSKDGMDVVTTADLDQSHPRLDVEIPHCAAYRTMSAAPTLSFETKMERPWWLVSHCNNGGDA